MNRIRENHEKIRQAIEKYYDNARSLTLKGRFYELAHVLNALDWKNEYKDIIQQDLERGKHFKKQRQIQYRHESLTSDQKKSFVSLATLLKAWYWCFTFSENLHTNDKNYIKNIQKVMPHFKDAQLEELKTNIDLVYKYHFIALLLGFVTRQPPLRSTGMLDLQIYFHKTNPPPQTHNFYWIQNDEKHFIVVNKDKISHEIGSSTIPVVDEILRKQVTSSIKSFRVSKSQHRKFLFMNYRFWTSGNFKSHENLRITHLSEKLCNDFLKIGVAFIQSGRPDNKPIHAKSIYYTHKDKNFSDLDNRNEHPLYLTLRTCRVIYVTQFHKELHRDKREFTKSLDMKESLGRTMRHDMQTATLVYNRGIEVYKNQKFNLFNFSRGNSKDYFNKKEIQDKYPYAESIKKDESEKQYINRVGKFVYDFNLNPKVEDEINKKWEFDKLLTDDSKLQDLKNALNEIQNDPSDDPSDGSDNEKENDEWFKLPENKLRKGDEIVLPSNKNNKKITLIRGKASGDENNCLIHSIIQLLYGYEHSKDCKELNKKIREIGIKHKFWEGNNELIEDINIPQLIFSLGVKEQFTCQIFTQYDGWKIQNYKYDGLKYFDTPRHFRILHENHHYTPLYPHKQASKEEAKLSFKNSVDIDPEKVFIYKELKLSSASKIAIKEKVKKIIHDVSDSEVTKSSDSESDSETEEVEQQILESEDSEILFKAVLEWYKNNNGESLNKIHAINCILRVLNHTEHETKKKLKKLLQNELLNKLSDNEKEYITSNPEKLKELDLFDAESTAKIIKTLGTEKVNLDKLIFELFGKPSGYANENRKDPEKWDRSGTDIYAKIYYKNKGRERYLEGKKTWFKDKDKKIASDEYLLKLRYKVLNRLWNVKSAKPNRNSIKKYMIERDDETGEFFSRGIIRHDGTELTDELRK